MKKILKIFYILIIFSLGAFLLYNEKIFLKEIETLKNEREAKKELILKNIDENYNSRKEDFYKVENKK